MRKLITIFIIISITTVFPYVGNAQESGRTIIPDCTVYGKLDATNQLDTFHVTFEKPGVYKINASLSDLWLGVSLRVYSGGSYSTVRTLYTENSTIISLQKSGLHGINRKYQLAIYSRSDIPPDEIRNYSVSIISYTGEEIIRPDEIIQFDISKGAGYMFVLDTSLSSTSHYEFSLNSLVTTNIRWEIYNEASLPVTRSLTTGMANYSLELQNGEYFIFVENLQDEIYVNLQMAFYSTNFQVMEPNSELTFQDLESCTKDIIIPFSKEMQYKIDIQTSGIPNGTFELFFGSCSTQEVVTSGNLIGDGSNTLDDITVFPGYIWLLLSDSITSNEIAVYEHHGFGYAHANNRYLFRLNIENGPCDITIDFSEVNSVPTLTNTNNVSVSFVENEPEAFRPCYVQPDSSMTLFELNIDYRSFDHKIIAVEPLVFSSNDWNQYYLYKQRPWLDEEAKQIIDEISIMDHTKFSGAAWINTTVSEEIYQQNERGYWIIIRLDDYHYDEHVFRNQMSGIVNLSIMKRSSYDIATGESIRLMSSQLEQSFVFRSFLQSGHTYRFSIDHGTPTTYSTLVVYNSSGFEIPTTDDISWKSGLPKSSTINEAIFFSDKMQEISFLISIFGDGEVILILEDKTAGVDYIIVGVGLIGVFGVGVFLGKFIEKRGLLQDG
ncbi:MAG: hypothetical protein GF411_19160 [Candidatus Lokiarchaeota archaeon]|nr:hypothetical protein [Candidatus Lokiarchaeota archaeon]